MLGWQHGWQVVYSAAGSLLPPGSSDTDLGMGAPVNSSAPFKMLPGKQQVESIQQEVWQQWLQQ